MRLTTFEQALPDERFAQKELDVLLGPILSWQRLQEHHDLLEIHSLELVGPLDEESGADVEVEFGEALVFGLKVYIGKRVIISEDEIGLAYKVCVPHANRVLNTDFAH